MSEQTTDSLLSDVINAFNQRVAAAWSPALWTSHTVLVALSGGPDSVALLHSLLFHSQASGRIVAGHVNHRLRSPGSDQDQQFVEGLAKLLGVRLVIKQLDAARLKQDAVDGLEAAARTERYRALQQMAHQVGARFLVMGHTLDDQIETVLFRIGRGTGISGLAGIPATRQIDPSLSIVRPLLQLRRNDVVAYLAALDVAACTDASNFDSQFSRNWIRNELLPFFRSKFPSVDRSLAQLACLARDYQQFAVTQAEPLIEQAVIRRQPNYLTIKRDFLAEQPKLLVQIVLNLLWERQGWAQQAMSAEKWHMLVRLVCEPGSTKSTLELPGGVRATRDGNELQLTRLPQAQG